jgi:hypothetical protein
MNKTIAGVLSVLICGTVLSPVYQGFTEHPQDDFPLSWFPMFARPRPETEKPVYVVAVEADGTQHKVGQNWWTSGGFNQGATQLLSAAQNGEGALKDMCIHIAKRIRQRPKMYAFAKEIHILKGEFSREAYFREGQHAPMRVQTLYRCDLP